MTSLSPIALFVFKRPEHTRKTLISLAANPESKSSALYVFSDAAKNDSELSLIHEVRQVIRSQQWCKEVHFIERQQNYGLAKSITEGVTQLCNQFGRVIVLEDDLELAPSFLSFMNKSLELYKEEPKVFQITGYCYPIDLPGKHDAFFIPHGACWGWATWKRAWDHFYTTESILPKLKNDPAFRRYFDMDDAYPYSDLLKMQAEGKVDSWGVRWYETILSNDGLLLMPRKSRVKNTGMDGSGTHRVEKGFVDKVSELEIKDFPPVSIDQDAYDKLTAFFHKRKCQQLGMLGYLKDTARKILKYFF